MKKIKYKTKGMKNIEEQFGKPIEELLYVNYIELNKSAEKIGKELGVSHVSINKWLLLMGIKRRINQDKLIKMCKERLKNV